MTLIVKVITRLTVGLILLYGIYIILHGHVSPGGGFAGGVIMSLAIIHLMLAFGKDMALKKVNETTAAFLESLGAILFVTIGVMGIFSGYIFVNFLKKGKPFDLFSGGNIPLYNIAISLKVGAGLFTIIFIMVVLFGIISQEEEKK